MKALENELSKKDASLSELKVQLEESREKEQATRQTVTRLKEEVCSVKTPYSELLVGLYTHTDLVFVFLGRWRS